MFILLHSECGQLWITHQTPKKDKFTKVRLIYCVLKALYFHTFNIDAVLPKPRMSRFAVFHEIEKNTLIFK